MTRAEAIARITASLARLSDERIELLAEVAASWSDDSGPAEDDETRAAIAEGTAQADRGEFASDVEVAAAYGHFRR
jgi:chorismate mutase